MTGSINRPWLIVAHDAGGAEVISAWLQNEEPEFPYQVLVEGPALQIFKKLNSSLRTREVLKDLAAFEGVIAGTGWESDLEISALAAAKIQNKITVAVLDHWTNYRKRFLDANGSLIVPDEIWVGDEEAARLVRLELPEVVVIKSIRNYYLESMVRPITHFAKGSHPLARVLFLAQPISAAAKKVTGEVLGYGYTEFEALEKTLQVLTNREGDERVGEFRLRLHPQEVLGKYDRLLATLPDSIVVSVSDGKTQSLAEDCSWADEVIGCDTMAMVVAAMAQKKVFCAIPAGGKPMALPSLSIERLFQ